MTGTARIARRLRDMVREFNREVAVDAVLRVCLGVAFSLVVFGFIFWGAWFFGIFYAHYAGLQAWQLGIIVAGLFLAVATWSAWRRVDPLSGLRHLTAEERLLTLISQITPGVLYFSPRHATAGAAVVLIGGPAGVIQGIGSWAGRLRADESLRDEAARLLAACAEKCPVEQVDSVAAAVLLRRLALIKVVAHDDSAALELTDKGYTVLAVTKRRGDK